MPFLFLLLNACTGSGIESPRRLGAKGQPDNAQKARCEAQVHEVPWQAEMEASERHTLPLLGGMQPGDQKVHTAATTPTPMPVEAPARQHVPEKLKEAPARKRRKLAATALDEKEQAASPLAQQWWCNHCKDYQTTAALVEAFNKATSDQAKQGLAYGLHRLVEHFENASADIKIFVNREDITAYLDAYATLANLAPASPNHGPARAILRRFYRSLYNVTPESYVAGEQSIMQLLASSLPRLDPTIFDQGETGEAIRLSRTLLERVKDLKNQEVQHSGNYGLYLPHFEALQSAYDLIRNMLTCTKDQGRWARTDEYKELKKVLLALKDRIKTANCYYPFLYQVYLTERSLKALKAPPARLASKAGMWRATKRTGQFLGNVARIISSISVTLPPVPAATIDIDKIGQGGKGVKNALHRRGLYQNKERLEQQHVQLNQSIKAILAGEQDALQKYTQAFELLAKEAANINVGELRGRGLVSRWSVPTEKGEKERLALFYDLLDSLLGLAAVHAAALPTCESLAKELSGWLKTKPSSYKSEKFEKWTRDIHSGVRRPWACAP